MTILPIELFDILIDILKHDRRTLNALSLTHPLITPHAQRRIFAHITLSGEQDDTDNDNSILLALTNQKHDHLLTYIHGLTLTNLIHARRRPSTTNSLYVPNHLVPAFVDAIAPQLSSLILRGFAPGWDHNSSIPLRNAIIRLLNSPKLTHLDLSGVNKFPLSLLNCLPKLTHFRFATPYPSHTPMGTIVPATPDIYLDTLDINLWGENAPRTFIEWLLKDSRLSVARLRKLSINGAYTLQVALAFWKLLDACHSTLRHLSLGPHRFSYESYNTLHHLCVLNTLRLETEITCYEGLVTPNTNPFGFLVYILTNLSSPSTLQYLDILVRYSWTGDEAPSWQSMDMSAWEALASNVLSQIQMGKFAHLKGISIGVSTVAQISDDVTLQCIFSMIRDRFSAVLQCPNISIGFFGFI